ncbi:MAG TPA: phenylalanine--tRNA ligase subunit alpha, partial [Actinomycetota bacterium]|nr:phenylalanine--tRNA ligase subunit alpha [Actinomycetota bacterium]
MSPVDELQSIEKQALDALSEARSSERVQELQIAYLGRKGPLARVGKTLGSLPVEERKVVGQVANRVRGLIESAIAGKLADL